MRNIFDINSPFFRKLSRMADIMILNILFVCCSIPIFTIGTSLSAMFYVMFKMRDDEEGYIARTFFKAFRENFKKSTIIWIVLFVIAFILRADLLTLNTKTGTFAGLLKILVFILMFIWGCVFVYVFPLQAKFENTIQNTFRNAFFMAMGNLKQTIAMLVMFVAPLLLMVKSERILWYIILFWIVIGFGLIAWFQTHYLVQTFKPFIPEEPEDDF